MARLSNLPKIDHFFPERAMVVMRSPFLSTPSVHRYYAIFKKISVLQLEKPRVCYVFVSDKTGAPWTVPDGTTVDTRHSHQLLHTTSLHAFA